MDVVVRTPHGNADVDVAAVPCDASLADLLGAITGQAAPATARVDGRTVATSRPVRGLDLAIGSLIDTRPETTPRSATAVDVDGEQDGSVALLQLTGRGAGSVSRFRTGRYRVGSARRLRAPEMEWAPVETPAFVLEVARGGAVHVSPGFEGSSDTALDDAYAPMLDGRLLERRVEWAHGQLSVGGRVFELERAVAPRRRRPLPAPDADGSIAFHRSPGSGRGPRPLIVGAVRAAAAADPVWQRRRADPAAFEVAFGIDRAGVTTTIDLHCHRGVALVGSEPFTTGIARSILVEIATSHGPADLGVVLASTPERVAHWSWAEWLPHVHSGGPGSIADVFSDPTALANWADSLRSHPPTDTAHATDSSEPTVPTEPRAPTAAPVWQPPDSPTGASRLTMLIVDDVSLWSRRDSPIRSLLNDPPPELRIVALCAGPHEAPAMCTTLVEEVSPDEYLYREGLGVDRTHDRSMLGSLADLHLREGEATETIADIRPALVETTTAHDVARCLAPLDDIEAHWRLPAPTRIAPPTLDELVSESAALGPAPVGAPHLTVAIGMAAARTTTVAPAVRRPVTVDLDEAMSTVLAVSEARRHDLSVAAMILGAVAQRRPDELAVLVIGPTRPGWGDLLPHLAGWIGDDDAADPARLVHRIAHVLTERPGLEVLVVIEHVRGDRENDAATRGPGEGSTVVDDLAELASSLPQVHLLITTADLDNVPERLGWRDVTSIEIGTDGIGEVRRGHETTRFIGVAATSDVPSGPHATDFDAPRLVVRPTTHARSATPLERRLTRTALAEREGVGEDDTATATVALEAARRARAIPQGPSAASGVDGGSATEPVAPSRIDLVPPPVPEPVAVSTLLGQHQGDGIPIGLVDRPDRGENDVYWWQPGIAGSLVVVGSPRSGMTSVLDLLITGVAARIPSDDVHVYAIEALPQRRRAIDALPHSGGVVAPADLSGLTRMIGALHEMLTTRTRGGDRRDQADLLILVGDASRVRRTLSGDANRVFDQLVELAVSGSAFGINVIVVANRTADLDGLIALSGDRLVGAVSDPGDRVRLGAPASGPADRQVGRCWSTTVDRLVQLAIPPDSVEHEIAALAPEGPHRRHPVRLPAGGDA